MLLSDAMLTMKCIVPIRTEHIQQPFSVTSLQVPEEMSSQPEMLFEILKEVSSSMGPVLEPRIHNIFGKTLM